MENRPKTPSVMAKLMGLDESPPRQRPVYRQQRALSENYLQQSGSIGKRSRKDSPNSLLGSKKRANLKTNKDDLSGDFKQESLGVDVMQGLKVENGKLPTKTVVLRPNLGNVQHGPVPSFLLDARTVFAWEVKKQLLERHKMTKVRQLLQPDFLSSVGVKSKEGWKYDSVAKLNTVKTSRNYMARNSKKKYLVSDSSTLFTESYDAEPDTKNVQSFVGDTKDRSNCYMKDGYSSHLSDNLDSPTKSPDEHHSDGEVETDQHSPNSVLETPFMVENSSSSESEENDIKPETITSTDNERSTCTGQNTINTIPSGAKENRAFSYLVEALNESFFQDGNTEIRFERWHSSECMAGPSVFETLEKKYRMTETHETWHKAERRLLFDRINSGLEEIFRPQVDIGVFAKPLRRKMRNMLKKHVIEEELWALLVSQENGVDDGVSEKAVGRGQWFDPVDELDCLVKEIEIFLFDELVGELVTVFWQQY